MSIATWDKKLWTATVYYVIDNKFNFYFLSEPGTMHCQNIAKSAQVACTITHSSQKVTVKKIGVQLRGKASVVNNLQKMRWMLALWNKINPGFEKIITLQNIENKVIKSKIYQIEPEVIKFFNEELYGPEGFEIFKF